MWRCWLWEDIPWSAPTLGSSPISQAALGDASLSSKRPSLSVTPAQCQDLVSSWAPDLLRHPSRAQAGLGHFPDDHVMWRVADEAAVSPGQEKNWALLSVPTAGVT